jgi:hypothetical protein
VPKIIETQTVGQRERSRKIKRTLLTALLLTGRAFAAFVMLCALLNMSFIQWTPEKQNVFNWALFFVVGGKAYKKFKA